MYHNLEVTRKFRDYHLGWHYFCVLRSVIRFWIHTHAQTSWYAEFPIIINIILSYWLRFMVLITCINYYLLWLNSYHNIRKRRAVVILYLTNCINKTKQLFMLYVMIFFIITISVIVLNFHSIPAVFTWKHIPMYVSKWKPMSLLLDIELLEAGIESRTSDSNVIALCTYSLICIEICIEIQYNCQM